MANPRPDYGISRIDQPEKKNHGWNVRITHKGKMLQRYFPDKTWKGKGNALKEARKWRDQQVKKLPKAKQEAASRKRRKVKQSGVVGVTHVVSKANGKNTYEYWQAAWLDAKGHRRTAKYSIGRYGNAKALQLAKEARGKKSSAPAKKKAVKKKAVAKKKAPAKKKVAAKRK